MNRKNVITRLDRLQKIADRNRPCKMTVIFANGSTCVTDPAGVIALLNDLEQSVGKG